MGAAPSPRRATAPARRGGPPGGPPPGGRGVHPHQPARPSRGPAPRTPPAPPPSWSIAPCAGGTPPRRAPVLVPQPDLRPRAATCGAMTLARLSGLTATGWAENDGDGTTRPAGLRSWCRRRIVGRDVGGI